jgi:hypothetical protein
VYCLGSSPCKFLPRRHGSVTTPPRRRGPGPRPLPSFKYNLRPRTRVDPSIASPTRDNLVPARPGSSAMSPASGAGSGKETTLTLEALAKHFDSFEEILRSLSTHVADNEQQTQVLNIALLRVEHGNVAAGDKDPAPGNAAAAPPPVVSNGEPSGAASRAADSSVAPPPAFNRPAAAASPPQWLGRRRGRGGVPADISQAGLSQIRWLQRPAALVKSLRALLSGPSYARA